VQQALKGAVVAAALLERGVITVIKFLVITHRCPTALTNQTHFTFFENDEVLKFGHNMV
jgi:hypothetical protein